MADTIVLEFPSSYKWLNMIDLVCGEVSSEMGFGREALNAISICVIEACTNALEHGNKCCPEREVRAVFKRRPDRMVIEVIDCGRGFDFKEYLKHIPDPSDIHNQRGRGIYIMKQMMDSIAFEKLPGRGMKITLEKMIDGDAEKNCD